MEHQWAELHQCHLYTILWFFERCLIIVSVSKLTNMSRWKLPIQGQLYVPKRYAWNVWRHSLPRWLVMTSQWWHDSRTSLECLWCKKYLTGYVIMTSQVIENGSNIRNYTFHTKIWYIVPFYGGGQKWSQSDEVMVEYLWNALSVKNIYHLRHTWRHQPMKKVNF